MPRDEIDLIDLTCRMFTDPVLKVNLPRVQAELVREIKERDESMLAVLKLVDGRFSMFWPTVIKKLMIF
jgi:hypothetical protein